MLIPAFSRLSATVIVTLVAASVISAAPIVRSGTGPDTASVQPVFNLFLADLGGVNNGTTAGSQASGFRLITWDGGGAAATATTFTSPMTAFSNRGNVYTTAGTGFEISGQPNPEFGDINPTYPGIFTTFSSPRLFAPLGSNVMDVLFTAPGSTTIPALSSGFGVVFTDVDTASTTVTFFDRGGASLGTWTAPIEPNGLSFLGVSFGEAVVSRVRIVSGNTALGPTDGALAGPDLVADVVAMDDFVFGEPQAVPEPSTLLLMGAGLALVAFSRRRR